MERWLNKVLNFLHREINLKNVLKNIKNRLNKAEKQQKSKKDTKVRVDIVLKYPTL
jgi:hypothetical protein